MGYLLIVFSTSVIIFMFFGAVALTGALPRPDLSLVVFSELTLPAKYELTVTLVKSRPVKLVMIGQEGVGGCYDLSHGRGIGTAREIQFGRQ